MARCRFESHCWRDRIGPKGGRKGATYKKWAAHDEGKNMMVSQISYALRPGTSTTKTTSKTNNHGLHTPTISTECPEIYWAAY
jgi:hypothetical protein